MEGWILTLSSESDLGSGQSRQQILGENHCDVLWKGRLEWVNGTMGNDENGEDGEKKALVQRGEERREQISQGGVNSR